MYYKVTVPEVTYQDQSGTDRRATEGMIIYLERRAEAKRLLKEKKLAPAADSEVDINKDFVLQTESPSRPQQSPKKAEEVTKSSDKAKAVPQNGDLVEAKVDGQTKVGEVVHVYPNNKVKVRFSEDSQKHRQMEMAEVEVIG